MAAVQITQGTQTTIQTTLVGGTETQVIRLDIGGGTNASPFSGTLQEISNLVGGTLKAGTVVVTAGTIVAGTLTALTAGTITNGTVDTISQLPPNYFGTVVTTGTNTLGTIKAGISGSAIYVTDLIISVGSASNVEIGNGGTANNIAGTFFLALNGGVVCNFRTPIYTSVGSALVYKQSTGCPLTITTQGYVK